MTRYQQIISFLKEIEKFKQVTRITYLSDQKTLEDDAQHTWHMAMMLLCLKDEIGLEFDVLKAMKLILIHDLGEIYVGDSFIGFDQEAKKRKDQKEQESLDKILSLLPDDLREEFSNLAQEYNNRTSLEAKIVKAIDQIQYEIQYITSGGLYVGKGEMEWSTEKSYEYGKKKVEFNEYLYSMFKDLLEEAKKYD